MNKGHSLLFILSAALLTGCAPSSSPPSLPSPTQTPEAEPGVLIIVARGATSWRITLTSQPRAYSVIRATIVSQPDGPVSQLDSITSRLVYSVGVTRSADSLLFSGSVASSDVRHSVLQAESTTEFQVPFSFTGRIINHVISAYIPGGSRPDNTLFCENVSRTVLGVIQHNVILLPLELSSGQTWSDSTSATICAGTVPMNLSTVRTSHVVGQEVFDGVSALIIDQNERTFSKGEGSQGQHRVFIEGRGTAAGRIYVDRTSGQLLSARTTNQTTFSIQSSGRNQQFLQISTEVTQIAR